MGEWHGDTAANHTDLFLLPIIQWAVMCMVGWWDMSKVMQHATQYGGMHFENLHQLGLKFQVN